MEKLNTRFDEHFYALKSLNWLPWVGQRYRENGVLVVTESHYDDGDGWLEDRSATRAMVNNQGLSSQNPDFRNRKIFTQIDKTLLNRSVSTYEERDALWRNVGFYNLVQRLMRDRGERPTEEDFDRAWENFFELVDILKPRVILKYGYGGIGRLGSLLHNTDTLWQRDDIGEFHTKPYCINLTNGEHKLKIIFTHHPTGAFGFDYEAWAEHIENNYSEVGNLFLAEN